MLRYKKHVLWVVLAMMLGSALWALNIEITYERNVRHLRTDLRTRRQHPIIRWRAQLLSDLSVRM